MTYQQTLNYMYTQLPMFSQLGSKAIKAGFNNIQELCKELNAPHLNARFVHVAGTNGKGSVSHMLASILQSAGYTTGLYTSPHLRDFRERIKVNGEMIGKDDVTRFIKRLKPVIETLKPSFFEISVAMAFDHFKKNKTHISIIETGLGGRLDSTNIITPQLSIITNIGYDHMQILGNTLPEIALEKAGIIKAGIPVIIGEKDKETAGVFKKKAKEMKAPIYFAADQFEVVSQTAVNDQLTIEVVEKDTTLYKKYVLDLTAQYQTKNLLSVLSACTILNNTIGTINEQSIITGLGNVRKFTGFGGRWETIHQRPRIILDVAHNESGVAALLQQLEITRFQKLHVILGMVKDKDVDNILRLFPSDAAYYFTNARMPRAMDAGTLMQRAAVYDLKGEVYEQVNDALSEAKRRAHADDLILICGSVFLIGEMN